MQHISQRIKIIFATLSCIIVIAPWLNGGLTEGFVYELILILGGLCLILLAAVCFVEKKPIRVAPFGLIIIPCILFLIGLIYSSSQSIRPYTSWSETWLWLAGLGIFFIVSQIATLTIQRWLCYVLCTVGTVFCVAGFILFIVSPTEAIDFRLDSYLYNPNLLSGYILSIWPIAACILFSAKKRSEQIALYSANIVMGAALLLTVSYTAWVSAVPLLFIWIVLFRKPLFTKRGFGFTVLAIVLMIGLAASLRAAHIAFNDSTATVEQTLTEEGESTSANQRQYFVHIGVELFRKHPFTGVGLGNLKLAYQQIQSNILETPRSLHNHYLDLLVETGIFGLTGFVGFGLVILYGSWRQTKLRQDHYSVGIILALLGLLMHGFIDFAWQIKIIMVHFFMLSGMVYGVQLQSTTARSLSLRSTRLVAIGLLFLAILFVGRGVQLFLSINSQIQGERYQELDDYETALSYYETAWNYNKNPANLGKIGLLHYAQRDYTTATTDALTWQQASPTDPAAYQLLGRVYQATGDLAAAKQQFEKADDLAPLTHPEIKSDLVAVYYALGDYNATINTAAAFYTTYTTQTRPMHSIDLDKHLTTILSYQGQAYLALGDNSTACQAWTAGLQEQPSNDQINSWLTEHCK